MLETRSLAFQRERFWVSTELEARSAMLCSSRAREVESAWLHHHDDDDAVLNEGAVEMSMAGRIEGRMMGGGVKRESKVTGRVVVIKLDSDD
eukprot:1408527-Rhodomonas_salina.1